MACVCKRYNARSYWLIVTDRRALFSRNAHGPITGVTSDEGEHPESEFYYQDDFSLRFGFLLFLKFEKNMRLPDILNTVKKNLDHC